MRIHAPYDLAHVRPSVLIVGNSRSAVLPPQAFQREGEVAYNASLPGAKLEEIRRVVEHADATHPLRLVVIGLDQIMFRKGDLDAETIKGLTRYRRTDPSLSDRLHFLYRRFDDYYRSLFSLTAIADAWRALEGDPQNEIEVRDDGTWYLESIKNEGPRKKMYRKLAMKIYRTQIAEQSDGLEFDELMGILDFTDAHDIQTILLVSPMQGLILNAIELAGAWEQYTNWQRELVAQVAARHPATAIYGVEDKPQIILDPIESPQRLFRDGVHYTSRAAAQIAQCLNGVCEENFRPTRLDSQSIDAYIDQLDALRAQYAHDHPAEMAELKKWIVKEKKKPGDST